MMFPANLTSLPKMLLEITSFLEKKGASSQNVKRIELASEEAIVNIISYAYPIDEGNQFISLEINSLKGNEIELEIRDRGIPFDPTVASKEVKNDVPLSERKIGGLGIFLMHKLADKMDYQRVGNENILKLKFHLT